MKFNWKIGGEAGFGIMTTGLLVSKIAIRSGYHIFDYNEYPSLIRGGHNTYEVHISDEEVRSMKWGVDLLICLNEDTFKHHKNRLSATSLVVYDPDEFVIDADVIKIPVYFKKHKKEMEVHQMMINTIAMGATIALLDGDLNLFFEIIEGQFKRKGSEVVDFNKKLAQVGYDEVVGNSPQHIRKILTRKHEKEKMIMTGNDAFAFGSVAADCRFFAAYPMTPTSTILSTLADWQIKTGMVVRHSEDEIAVINSALGASFVGARSAVGTSGGGFALMVEAISYAGVAEIPIVIMLGQRPGPATGMPTWTEQGDLLFAVHSGHGEFPKIVLAPGDVNEMVKLTAKAFDLADMYQLPVIVMGDKLVNESHKSEIKKEILGFMSHYTPNRGKTVTRTKQSPYLRFKLEHDGISERLIPGQAGVFYQANSYDHLEDSHTTEEALPRQQQVDKRFTKWHTYKRNHFVPPEVIGDPDRGKVVFVSWGGNKGTIIEAQKLLLNRGVETSFIHFSHIYPLDKAVITPLFHQNKRYVLVENNASGQFGQLLRMETGIDIEEKILKYNGRPFWPEEIADYIAPMKVDSMKNLGILDKLKSYAK